MNSTNEVVQTILSRRSIRFGYDRRRAVAHELLGTITLCGLAAPSSKNAKPWRFHVVTSFELLDKIAALMESAPEIEEYVPHDPRTGRPHEHWQSTVIESAAVLRDVPAAIFIENRGVFSGGRPTLRNARPEALAGSLASYAFECVGIGTALENMWISAISLGLSASFVGDVAIAETAVAAALGIEGDLIGVLVLGFSNAAPLAALPSPDITQVDDPVDYH
jgi:nitroreductase